MNEDYDEQRAKATQARIVAWTTFVLALALGAASLWKVTEQDIFWQIRAGEELVQTRSFPQVDDWSFTATGKPWWNVQWLATLLFAGVYALGKAPALVIARGVLVAVLLLRLGVLVRVVLPRSTPSARAACVVATVLPLSWTAIGFRLELRSDTLVFVLFTELLVRLHAGRLREWQLPLFVMLAANLHVGTAPFVAALALYTCATGWQHARRRQLTLTALASCVALFVTPYHVRVLRFWLRHFFYASHTVMQNPDHQPLAWRHLSPTAFGLHGLTWAGLSLVALTGLWLRWQTTRAPGAPTPALPADTLVIRDRRRDLWLTALGALLLTALCFNRIRTFPYQLLFLAPHLARTFETFATIAGRYAKPTATSLSAIAVSVVVRQVTHGSPSYGLSLSRQMYPIGSAAFIERERLSPNLFHTFAYGAYTVYALRDYRDFVDTRETMFDDLQATILDAYASPEITRKTMDRFGINTTLVPIPKTALVPGLGYRNAITEYLPKREWALVYFDDISVVVVRRIPAHAALLERHEYHLLYPNLPAGNFLRTTPTPDDVARYRAETERCLGDEPNNLFCQRTRALIEAYTSAP